VNTPTAFLAWGQSASPGGEVVVADPNFAPMYATRTRKVKTDRRDARALQEACLLGAYRPAHRLSDAQRHVRGRLAVRDALVRTRTGYIALIRALLRRHGWRVPNDLLADNYIEQDDRLRLVDWEYSGNGDPAFDLGNTCRELDYDEGRLQELCQAYFRGAPAPLVARVRLHMIVSDVGWALWAAIQTAISRIAFDFEAYGAARWRRAEAGMDSSDFPRWLEAVTHPHAAGST